MSREQARREGGSEFVERRDFNVEECKRLARDRTDRKMTVYGGREDENVPEIDVGKPLAAVELQKQWSAVCNAWVI